MNGEASASGPAALTRRAVVVGGCQVAVAAAIARPLAPARRPPVSAVAQALRTVATLDPITGPEDAAVARVAVMTVPSLAAMRRAVTGGCNLILSLGSPFYANPPGPGRPRGIILLGHMGTEDQPMALVARWLRGFVPGLPIDFVPAREPFHPPLPAFASTLPGRPAPSVRSNRSS